MTRNQLINELKKTFDVRELVCKHCYDKFKNNSWQFLSTELLHTLYVLRNIVFCKPIIINNWHTGGNFSQRGLRCNICQLVKSKDHVYISAHLLGKGVDFNVVGLTHQEVNDLIRMNSDKFIYPIRLESNTNGWSHVDCYQPFDSETKLIEFKG